MAERSETAATMIITSSSEVPFETVEVVARTAHGVIEVGRHPDTGFFSARHVLHDGGLLWLPPSPIEARTLHTNANGARRACLDFYEQWKQEFALEYLAYSLEP